MKKIFIIPTLIFCFSNNAIADTISACNIELQTNEYEPDLILSEKYKTAGKCLEDEILSRAKAIFLPEQYADFEKSFKQLSSAYLQVATDINENNKNSVLVGFYMINLPEEIKKISRVLDMNNLNYLDDVLFLEKEKVLKK